MSVPVPSCTKKHAVAKLKLELFSWARVIIFNSNYYSYFLRAKQLQSSLYKKRFSKYMFLKIGILLIPLLANEHIFQISKKVHPYTHGTSLDFANAFLSRDKQPSEFIVPLPGAYARSVVGSGNIKPIMSPEINQSYIYIVKTECKQIYRSLRKLGDKVIKKTNIETDMD